MSSSQYAYQLRMKAAGRCIRCGKERGDSPYSTYCIRCAKRIRRTLRKKKGYAMWKKGQVGRPPLTEVLVAPTTNGTKRRKQQ